MKRIRVFAAIAVLQIVFMMFYASAQTQGGKVDFSADVMLPVKIADTNAYSLVGDVIFYHNGTVITCDSAVRYGERRMECYKNVVINQDSTYIYGDKAVYNGLTNMVDVFSPIVKVLDGDATLYTRSFSFNTLDNIGRFSKGGIMRQGELQLESEDGYYFSDTHFMVGSGQVNMQDSVYKILTDSIRYNTDEKKAYFFENTRIWTDDGNFIMADEGNYEVDSKTYDLTENSFILTKDQEIRADSMWYNGSEEQAILRRNIQIFDYKNLFLAFGDYADYRKVVDGEEILLTENPSVASYEQVGDTLFLRSDTMLIHIIKVDTSKHELLTDSLEIEEEEDISSQEYISANELDPHAMGLDSLGMGLDMADSLGVSDIDSLAVEQFLSDSLALDSVAVDSTYKLMTSKELKEQKKKDKQEAARIKKEEKRAARQAKLEAKMQKRREKMMAIMGIVDSTALVQPLDSMAMDSLALDSMALDSIYALDSMAVDSMMVDSLAPLASLADVDIDEPLAEDTSFLVRRIFYSYGDVKAYRQDLQMICDSLVSYSIDSTVHLFGAPYMWSGENQINSEKAVIYTNGQQIDYMLFTGAPIMAAEVDTAHYNQIKGREIEARFRHNEIYKVDVLGNAQTYYFMVDDSTKLINGFLVAESSDMTFMLEERTVETISFYTQPVYTIYPMDKIPETQSLVLPDFKWNSRNRPYQRQVFNREAKDPIREQVESYEQPSFAIMIEIDELRKSLSERGEWIDREDELTPETREFMREIELKNSKP